MGSVNKVVYECDVCGTEVTVNSGGVKNLSPIYCCGISLTEKKTKTKKTATKQAAKKKIAKTTAMKPPKKTVKKTSAKPPKKR